MMKEAIEDCDWLRNRTIPKQAEQVGCNWACLWEGGKHGLDLDRFKAILQEEGVGVGWHFTDQPAKEFPIFGQSTAYHVDYGPVRCPYSPDFLAEGLDVVAVISPGPVHAVQSIAALRSGAHEAEEHPRSP